MHELMGMPVQQNMKDIWTWESQGEFSWGLVASMLLSPQTSKNRKAQRVTLGWGVKSVSLYGITMFAYFGMSIFACLRWRLHGHCKFWGLCTGMPFGHESLNGAGKSSILTSPYLAVFWYSHFLCLFSLQQVFMYLHRSPLTLLDVSRPCPELFPCALKVWHTMRGGGLNS